MVVQVTPISLKRRGSRLVIDVRGPVAGEWQAAITAACTDVSETLVNLSTAYRVSLECLKTLVAAVPAGLPVAFCSVPPSLEQRIDVAALARLGKILDD